MKKTATILFLMTAIGLQAQSGSQAFTNATAQANSRLEQALAELDKIQAEINQIRPGLAAKLDDVEGTALRLRDQATNAARIKQSFDVEVSQLEKEKQNVIDNNTYLQMTLLNEYSRRLELAVDPAEIAQYGDTLRQTIALLEDRGDVDDATVFTQQLKVVSLSLERIEQLLGGATFSGSAIVNGSLKDGTFVLVGPSSYFTDQAGTVGITMGMLENRANIYQLPEFAASITETANSGKGMLPVDSTDGEALEGITYTLTLMEEFILGGPVMIPILGLFLVAILVCIYKSATFMRLKVADTKDVHIILDLLRNGKQDAALAHAKSIGGPVGEMLTAAVADANEDREVLEEVLYESIIKTQPKLDSFMPFLAVVAATAPLLGLLGTVTGMMKTFKLITIVGTGDARNLSSGISEALITTKWGLIVAIPILIVHALLNRKAKGMIGSMEQAAVSFVNGVVELRERAGK